MSWGSPLGTEAPPGSDPDQSGLRAFPTLQAPGARRSGSRGWAGRGKMAAGGAADAQARFGHSVKGLLTEKVTSCGTDVIALTKQVLKGSRSAEVSGGCRRVADYRAGAERGAGRGKEQCMLGSVVRGGDRSSCLGRDRDRRTGMRGQLGSASGLRRWQAGGWLPALQGDRWERCLRHPSSVMDVLSRQCGDPRTVPPRVSPCQPSHGARETQSCRVSAWSVRLSFSSWVKQRGTW